MEASRSSTGSAAGSEQPGRVGAGVRVAEGWEQPQKRLSSGGKDRKEAG